MNSRGLLVAAFWFQGGLAGLGIFLGWLGFCDSSQELSDFSWRSVLQPALFWGLLGMLPMLGYLAVTHFLPLGPFRHIKDVVIEKLYPLLKGASIAEMALLSLLAGITEEVLFRWCIQGGLQEWLPGESAWFWALVIASLVFGAMHCINWSYALVTSFVGAFLGWLMVVSGTYLAPAITHALFDFVALLYITRWMPISDAKAQEDLSESSQGIS